MPHINTPVSGFQAVILCGPGASLDTFTSDASKYPKAIVPIANRPMVWYPLDWCYRMGISSIHLIIPPESKDVIEATLSQNPHLTSLPSPRPTILAPSGIDMNSGTAELFRHVDVRQAIKSDFVVLPCDIVSELPGLSLLQEWMLDQGAFSGEVGGRDITNLNTQLLSKSGEYIGRRGGLGVWYETKVENSVKGEQTDFVATIPISNATICPSKSSIRNHVSSVVYSMPTVSIKDKLDDDKGFKTRQSLLQSLPNVRFRSTVRDAHIYFLPYWALDFMQIEYFDSIGEDVVGSWAKATWQKDLQSPLNLDNILNLCSERRGLLLEKNSFEPDSLYFQDCISTYTQTARLSITPKMPPFLAYIQPSTSSANTLICRVDTSAALLDISLRIAALSASDLSSKQNFSSLAHSTKIAETSTVPQGAHVNSSTCLVAESVTIEPKCTIKESVIGAGCSIASGARLIKCLLMEGVVVGENVSLTGCIIGPRCKFDGGGRGKSRTDLKECEIQGGYVVTWGTEAKGEKFMISNLEDESEGGN